MFFNDKAIFSLIVDEVIQNRSTNLNYNTINLLINITLDYAKCNSVNDVSAEI